MYAVSRRSASLGSLGSRPRTEAGARSDGRADSPPHSGYLSIVWLFMVALERARRSSHLRKCSRPTRIGFRRGTGASPITAARRTRRSVHWLYWDNFGALLFAGIVLLVTPFFFGGIAALIGETVFPPTGPRGRRIISLVLLGLGAAVLVVIGLFGPRPVPPAEVALWAATGGPPLYFDAPHDGQVIAHMDLMRGLPPDIARIRISEAATGATVWDVQPSPALRVCWNGCWNLTLSAGPNPASFAAGRQTFKATVPKTPTFWLTRGTAYLFEVWDSRGASPAPRIHAVRSGVLSRDDEAKH